MKKTCIRCKKTFFKKETESRSFWNNKKYCSYGCYWKNRINNPKYPAYWKGKNLSEDTKTKLSESHKKIKLSDKFIKERHRLNRSRIGKKLPIETRMKMSLAQTGSKGSNWMGGKTPITERARKCIKYKIWRQDVFKRDNYTCQICGKRGVRLNADHIKSFAIFPSFRYKLSNGRTLCQNCHLKTINYGGRVRATK